MSRRVSISRNGNVRDGDDRRAKLTKISDDSDKRGGCGKGRRTVPVL